MRTRRDPRPAIAGQVGDGVKLHRRVLRCAGHDYTVITLRPGADCRFATNRYHEAWHVLSDFRGARLLGRLLWGLAYQRRPGTLVLIDRTDPNPFDAAPSDPIALVPSDLTALGRGAAHALRRHLPLRGAPDGTVRWHTHGLDVALARSAARRARPSSVEPEPYIPPRGREIRTERVGGLLTVAGTAEALKEFAEEVHPLGEHAWHGMDYTEGAWPGGEVQVFGNYRARVSAARVARRELAGTALASADLTPLIWDHGTTVRNRRATPAARE
jgi:hypothetical protein